MKHLGTAIGTVALFIALPAHAAEDCTKGVLKTDMCAEARRLANGIAPILPKQVSQNLSLESIASFGTTLQMQARLSYGRKALEESFKASGVPISQAKDALQKAAMTVCEPGSLTRSFIEKGGSFKYVYLFVDGEQFMSVPVDRCA